MQTISRRSPSRFRPAERHRRVSGKGRPSSSAGLPQANLTPNPKAPISTARQAERFLFSERTPNELVDRVVVKLSSEGLLAIVDLLFLDPVTPSNETEVLVIGAEKDNWFPIDTTKRIARIYGASAVLFSEMGHDMMLEPGWEAVADTITAWAAKRCEVGTQPRAAWFDAIANRLG